MDRQSRSSERAKSAKSAVAGALMTAALGTSLPLYLGCSQEKPSPTQQQQEELRQKTLKRGKSFSQETRRIAK
jgi:hypothetical protein